MKVINTIQEIKIDPETGEELPQVSQEELTNAQPSHSYKLRPKPTKRSSIYSMTHLNQQIKKAKPDAHVLMTQMSI